MFPRTMVGQQMLASNADCMVKDPASCSRILCRSLISDSLRGYRDWRMMRCRSLRSTEWLRSQKRLGMRRLMGKLPITRPTMDPRARLWGNSPLDRGSALESPSSAVLCRIFPFWVREPMVIGLMGNLPISCSWAISSRRAATIGWLTTCQTVRNRLTATAAG